MLANWIRMSTTTTGAGSLTLSGVSGYPGVTSQLATSERAAYVILDSSDLPIERGVGYWDGSGWVREAVAATYVGGTYTGGGATAATLAAGTKYLIVSPGAQTNWAARQGIWATTNKVYGDSAMIAAVGSISVAADRAYAVPARATVDSDIDAIVFRITTAAAAGKLAKGAIFSVGADGLPGVKLAEGAAVAADSTGVKASTFTRFRPPPVFFVCVLSDGTPTIQGTSSGIVSGESMGADSALIPNSFIYHNSATGLTFPTTWTPVGNASNSVRPGLFMRCP